MKKHIGRNKKVLLIVLAFLALFYIWLVRFALPYPFMAYENYHGLEFLNQIYGNQPCYISCYTLLDFFTDITKTNGNGPDSGFVPRLIYSPLAQLFPQNSFFILYIQAFLSIGTAFFFAVSSYLIFQKNVSLGVITFLIFITFPYSIKYGLTEDYYVVGNFFESLALLSVLLYAISTKLRYALIFFFSIAGAIYTRDLYILTLPIIFVTFVYVVKNAKTFQSIFSSVKFYILISFVLGIVFHRLPYILASSEKFGGQEPMVLSFLQRIEKFMYFYDFFPPVFGVFLLITLMYSLYTFRRGVFLLPIYAYMGGILYFYTEMRVMEMALLRHLNLLVPLFLIAVSFGIHIIYKKFLMTIGNMGKVVTVVGICCILLVPYLYEDEIQHLYNVQEEALFIEKTIPTLGNSFLLTHIDPKGNTSYRFPSYMLRNIKNADIQIIGIQDFKDIHVSDSQESIFYLSTACYIFPFEKNTENKTLQEDCQYMLNTYNLAPFAEKKMQKDSYVFPINTTLDTITIGFYRILSKK